MLEDVGSWENMKRYGNWSPGVDLRVQESIVGNDYACIIRSIIVFDSHSEVIHAKGVL